MPWHPYLMVVHVLPAQVLGPVDDLAPALVVHEHAELLADQLLHRLLAADLERVDQIAAPLVVGHLVQETLVRGGSGLRYHLVEDGASLR